jgi:hypothetical protein
MAEQANTNQVAQAAGPNPSFPAPPDLHWMIVLILTLITLGIFGVIWLFVEAAFVKRIDRKNNALLLYALFVLCWYGGTTYGFISGHPAVESFFFLAGIVLMLIGHFNMLSSLEIHYNRDEPMGLRLSGVLTFFFAVFYFQYHFSRIRRWKRTGVLD